jgi:hypothetical protein
VTTTKKIIISAVFLLLTACYSDEEVKKIASNCEAERIDFVVSCLQNSNKGMHDCEYFSIRFIETYGCGALVRHNKSEVKP